MDGSSALQAGNCLNVGDLVRSAARAELLGHAPLWRHVDGHGGRYVHAAGEPAGVAFAAAAATADEPGAPGEAVRRVLAAWQDRRTAPGGLALEQEVGAGLGVHPERRIVELDRDAVQAYPDGLRRCAQAGRVEEGLDWLLEPGQPTACVLDPYNYAAHAARRAAAAGGAAAQARMDTFLQPATLEQAVGRLRACGDGVLLVFSTRDRDAGDAPMQGLQDDLHAWARPGEAPGALRARATGDGRGFCLAWLGVGRGARIVGEVLALPWSRAWFVRAGLATVEAGGQPRRG